MPRGVYNRKKAKTKRKRGPNRTVFYVSVCNQESVYTKDELDEALEDGNFSSGDEFFLCVGKIEVCRGPALIKALPFKGM